MRLRHFVKKRNISIWFLTQADQTYFVTHREKLIKAQTHRIDHWHHLQDVLAQNDHRQSSHTTCIKSKDNQIMNALINTCFISFNDIGSLSTQRQLTHWLNQWWKTITPREVITQKEIYGRDTSPHKHPPKFAKQSIVRLILVNYCKFANLELATH